MKFSSLARLGALAGVVTLASSASAALVYQHGTETGNRFNPNSGTPPAGFTSAGSIAFTNAMFASGGNAVAQINSLTFGIRQISGAPAVNLHFFLTTMDAGGNASAANMQDLGVVGIAGVAASQTTLVTINPNVAVALSDQMAHPGNAGVFVGVRFEGPNASNNLNGWRITNAPAVGLTDDYFWQYDPTVPIDSYFFFGGAPVADFFLDIDATLVPAPGALALLGLAGIAARRRRA